MGLLHAPAHELPHERLEPHDLGGLQRIAEGLVQRDVARRDRGVRDAEHCGANRGEEQLVSNRRGVACKARASGGTDLRGPTKECGR